MQRTHKRLCTIVCTGLVALAAAASEAQQPVASSKTEVKSFEIVSVDGNRVVVKGAQGAQEITVPDDFRLTVDGQPVTVRELKPGMKGTATITTTTTVTPVHVTEVRNGEVMQSSGSMLIVRTPTGIRSFTEGEADKRGVKVFKDGRPVTFADLRPGDRLTATIVTSGAPKVMTQRQVDAAMSSAGTASPGAAPRAAASSGAATGSAATSGGASRAGAPAAPSATTGAQSTAAGSTSAAGGAPARTRLPRTAGSVPLIGALAVACFAAGLLLATRRRSRSM